jgi:hypothetical protein
VPDSVGALARGSVGTLVSEDEGKADLVSSKFSLIVVPASSPSDVVTSAMGSKGLQVSSPVSPVGVLASPSIPLVEAFDSLTIAPVSLGTIGEGENNGSAGEGSSPGDFLLPKFDPAKFHLVSEGGLELGARASLDSGLGPSNDGSTDDALLFVPGPLTSSSALASSSTSEALAAPAMVSMGPTESEDGHSDLDPDPDPEKCVVGVSL